MNVTLDFYNDIGKETIFNTIPDAINKVINKVTIGPDTDPVCPIQSPKYSKGNQGWTQGRLTLQY